MSCPVEILSKKEGKNQGFAEKHMLKECFGSRPACENVEKRDLTDKAEFTQRDKGQVKC